MVPKSSAYGNGTCQTKCNNTNIHQIQKKNRKKKNKTEMSERHDLWHICIQQWLTFCNYHNLINCNYLAYIISQWITQKLFFFFFFVQSPSDARVLRNVCCENIILISYSLCSFTWAICSRTTEVGRTSFFLQLFFFFYKILSFLCLVPRAGFIVFN